MAGSTKNTSRLKILSFAGLFLTPVLLMLTFQNCGKVDFQATPAAQAKPGGTGSTGTGNGEGYLGKPEKIYVRTELDPCRTPQTAGKETIAEKIYFYLNGTIIAENQCSLVQVMLSSSEVTLSADNPDIISYNGQIFSNEAAPVSSAMGRILLACHSVTAPGLPAGSVKVTIGPNPNGTNFLFRIENLISDSPLGLSSFANDTTNANTERSWRVVDANGTLDILYFSPTQPSGAGVVSGTYKGFFYDKLQLACFMSQ